MWWIYKVHYNTLYCYDVAYKLILTEILACFLPGQTKDLSAPLYYYDAVVYSSSNVTSGALHV